MYTFSIRLGTVPRLFINIYKHLFFHLDRTIISLIYNRLFISLTNSVVSNGGAFIIVLVTTGVRNPIVKCLICPSFRLAFAVLYKY
jgi:hypothetical protein